MAVSCWALTCRRQPVLGQGEAEEVPAGRRHGRLVLVHRQPVLRLVVQEQLGVHLGLDLIRLDYITLIRFDSIQFDSMRLD